MKYIGPTVSFSRSEPLKTKSELNITTGNAAAFFLKPKLSKVVKLYDNNTIESFNKSMNNIVTLPHASYAINLASNKHERHEESVNILVNEVKLADQFDTNVVFHPGTCDSVEEGVENVARGINKVHELTQYRELTNKKTPKLTHTGITILETMGGKSNGRIIGKKFHELRSIIDKVNDKKRVGICIDTCHLFVSGYDIRTEDKWIKVMEEFENEIGFEYLKGVHLNDSKTEYNSGSDRHETIGLGKIGVIPFQCIMKDSRFDDIPLVTETHLDLNGAKKELDILRSYI